MDKKYQVFVSSTFSDLKEERNQITKAILELNHIPVGMEMFSAADDDQWDVIKRTIDKCDYYIVIIAHRYGSEVGGVSYTEKEYDYALSRGVPILGFIIDSNATWPAKHVDKNPQKVGKLEKFIKKVKKKPVGFWKNSDDLYAKAPIALVKTFSSKPQQGWVRTPDSMLEKGTPLRIDEPLVAFESSADAQPEIARRIKLATSSVTFVGNNFHIVLNDRRSLLIDAIKRDVSISFIVPPLHGNSIRAAAEVFGMTYESLKSQCEHSLQSLSELEEQVGAMGSSELLEITVTDVTPQYRAYGFDLEEKHGSIVFIPYFNLIRSSHCPTFDMKVHGDVGGKYRDAILSLKAQSRQMSANKAMEATA